MLLVENKFLQQEVSDFQSNGLVHKGHPVDRCEGCNCSAAGQGRSTSTVIEQNQ